MATREGRIERAREIIHIDPDITKRTLQARLKAEFGVGLADNTRRELLAEANTPALLRFRVHSPAFSTSEKAMLKKAIHRAGAAPYVAAAINDRYLRARDSWQEARAAGWNLKEWKRRFLKQERDRARERGLLATKTTRTRDKPDGLVKGQMDWWLWLRILRDQAIERNEYKPKPRPKPRLDKGDVKAQKGRYDEKQSVKARARTVERECTRISVWVSQLDARIAAADGDKRRQLEQQRDNLLRTLEGVR